MRLDELTATVDALTGGQFGKFAWRWDEEDKGSTRSALPQTGGRASAGAGPGEGEVRRLSGRRPLRKPLR
jgi:hypothetical protein